MIVEQGVIARDFEARASIDGALAAAQEKSGIAWIGVTDPDDSDLAAVAQSLGLDSRELAEARRLRRSQRIERSFAVTRGDNVLDLLLLGYGRSEAGEFTRQGEIELLCRQGVLVAIANNWREPVSSVRGALLNGLRATPSPKSLDLLELIIRGLFQHYSNLLDDVEDSIDSLREAILRERHGSQLSTILQLYGPGNSALIGLQPFLHGLDQIEGTVDEKAFGRFVRRVRGDAAYLEARIERIDSTLASLQQTYFSLAQDEANRISLRQAETTKQLAGWALLAAVPTLLFGLYGANFEHVPLEGLEWGYPVMLLLVIAICLILYRRLRRAGWL